LEKVWIKGPKPSKVFEKDDAHYFYWPIEAGIGIIKIWKFKIPYFPKLSDYEPVKTVCFSNSTQVLTRFHYRVLVYFNNPILIQNKPIVDFVTGSHSPFVHSNVERIGDDIVVEDLDSREVDAITLLSTVLKLILIGKLHLSSDNLETYEIQRGNVPEESLFDLKKMRCVVWVGVFPTEQNTPKEVWQQIAGMRAG